MDENTPKLDTVSDGDGGSNDVLDPIRVDDQRGASKMSVKVEIEDLVRTAGEYRALADEHGERADDYSGLFGLYLRTVEPIGRPTNVRGTVDRVQAKAESDQTAYLAMADDLETAAINLGYVDWKNYKNETADASDLELAETVNLDTYKEILNGGGYNNRIEKEFLLLMFDKYPDYAKYAISVLSSIPVYLSGDEKIEDKVVDALVIGMSKVLKMHIFGPFGQDLRNIESAEGVFPLLGNMPGREVVAHSYSYLGESNYEFTRMILLYVVNFADGCRKSNKFPSSIGDYKPDSVVSIYNPDFGFDYDAWSGYINYMGWSGHVPAYEPHYKEMFIRDRYPEIYQEMQGDRDLRLGRLKVDKYWERIEKKGDWWVI